MGAIIGDSDISAGMPWKVGVLGGKGVAGDRSQAATRKHVTNGILRKFELESSLSLMIQRSHKN